MAWEEGLGSQWLNEQIIGPHSPLKNLLLLLLQEKKKKGQAGSRNPSHGHDQNTFPCIQLRMETSQQRPSTRLSGLFSPHIHTCSPTLPTYTKNKSAIAPYPVTSWAPLNSTSRPSSTNPAPHCHLPWKPNAPGCLWFSESFIVTVPVAGAECATAWKLVLNECTI